MALGADANNPFDVEALRANGRSFVLRYLSDDSWAWGRNLRTGEAAGYAAAGIRLGTIWQNGKSEEVLRGYGSGVSCAERCRALQRDHGLAGTPIFFSVDFPSNPDNIDTILDFMRGAKSIVGFGRMGCYGTWYTVKRCWEEELVKFPWQTKLWDPIGHIKPHYEYACGYQYGNADKLGWDHFGAEGYVAHDTWKDDLRGLVVPYGHG